MPQIICNPQCNEWQINLICEMRPVIPNWLRCTSIIHFAEIHQCAKLQSSLNALRYAKLAEKHQKLTLLRYTRMIFFVSIKVECSPLCQIGWYRNGTYIKNHTGVYSIQTQVNKIQFDDGLVFLVRSKTWE